MVLPSGFRDAPPEFSWRSRGAWIQFPPPFYSVADTDAWHSASGQPEVEAAAHPQTLKRINPRSRGRDGALPRPPAQAHAHGRLRVCFLWSFRSLRGGVMLWFPTRGPGAQTPRRLSHASARNPHPTTEPRFLAVLFVSWLQSLRFGRGARERELLAARRLLGAWTRGREGRAPRRPPPVPSPGGGSSRVVAEDSVPICARCWELFRGHPLNAFLSEQRQAPPEPRLSPSSRDVRTCFLLIFKSNSGPNR